MRYPRKRGSTSNLVTVHIPDNSVTTGGGLTGLTSASANLTVVYRRSLDAAPTVYSGANLEAQTTVGTYQAPSTSAKLRIKEISATYLPGDYELQFHDSATAFGTGDASDAVEINILETSTAALHIGPNACLIALVPWDYQDGVRMGLTALPAATPGAAGGVFLAGSNAAVTCAALTVSGATTLTGGLAGSITGNLSGSVGSVTGAVVLPAIPANWITAAGVNAAALNGKGDWSTYAGGAVASVTGNVGGNVVGSVGSVTAAVSLAASQHVIVDSGTVTTLTTLPAAPADWLAGAAVKADAVTKLQAGLSTYAGGDTTGTTTLLTRVPGTVQPQTGDAYARLGAAGAGLTALGDARVAHLDADVSTRLATAGYAAPPTAAAIAAAAWDLATAGHTTSGTFGAAMGAAGAAGDPWSTTLPGAYGAGTAGKILGTNLDAAVSSRSTYAGGAVAAVSGNVGGNVVGSVGSVTAAVTLPAVPADWLAASGVKADAVTKIQAGLSTYTGGDTTGTTALLARLTSGRATNLDFLDAAVSTRSTLTAAQARDVDNTSPAAGSLGARVNLASAGDPWGGVITAGQAGAALRAWAAVTLGNAADSADHRRTTFTDYFDGVTVRVVSVNPDGLARVVTVFGD